MGKSEDSSREGQVSSKAPRRNLWGFILYSIIELAVIALVSFLIIHFIFPSFFLPGVICVIVGLIIFTLVRYRLYSTSTSLPVEEYLIGKSATALDDFRKNSSGRWEGMTRVQGETWRAIADGRVSEGDVLQVTEVKGLRLLVKPIQEA